MSAASKTARADGTPLPVYPNQGTDRFSGSARFDFRQNAATTWRFDAGYATTGGGIITPVGPQEARPMRQGFGRLQFDHGRTRIGASFDAHYARSISLLSDELVSVAYQSGHVEVEHRFVRPRHVLTLAGIGGVVNVGSSPRDSRVREDFGYVVG